MTRDTITKRPDRQGISNGPLTEILRRGARDLIQQAGEAELTGLLEQYATDKTPASRGCLVRHGYLPEREIMTGVGAVSVKVPRVRDRGANAQKIRLTSCILPPSLRKAKSVEELLPWL